MRSKIITTVVGVLLLTPFSLLGLHDALSIKQHLKEQHTHIQKLKTESAVLDTKLNQTIQTKQQAQAQVDQLDQQTKDAQAEREKLEAELGAN